MSPKTVVLLLLVLVCSCSGAKILGIVMTPSYSHQIVFQPLWKELSLRGHQLTVLTTDPVNNSSLTNITEIDMKFCYKIVHDNIEEQIFNNYTLIGKFIKHVEVSDKLADAQLSHPEVQNLIRNQSEHFDLLIVEMKYPAMYAFAKRFNCPYIIMSSTDALPILHSFVGNPNHPVAFPMRFSISSPDTLTGRTMLLIYRIVFHYVYYYMIWCADIVAKKHFGEDVGPIYNIMANYSILFENIDPIFHPVKPSIPAIIRVGGGLHIKPAKPLSEELKKTLDVADNDVIYFSLGSNVNSTDIPKHTRKVIMEAFSEIPHKILWKFEDANMPGKPDNVIISKWYPQQDILSHPNLKVFITQGGLQSLDETIYFKKPIVGIPFFADQQYNIKRMVNKGVGLSLDYKTMTKDQLKHAVLEVLRNPKYRNKIAELSDLVRDEPMTGLERAVWWSEYVIRHKGARHLRSELGDLSFFQYFLLDVFGFLLTILLATLFIIRWTFRLIIKLFRVLLCSRKLKTQ